MYIKPRIVVIEETEHWLDTGLVEAAGQIFGVYIFDANKRVCCCEFTPSYYLEPFEAAVRNFDTISENDRDEIEEEWRVSTDAMYCHCSDIDRFSNICVLPTQRCCADEYDEAWEAIQEEYHANCPDYRLPRKPTEAEFKALRKLAKCQAEVERTHALCAEAASKLWEVDYA